MYSPLPIRPRANGAVGFYAQPLLATLANRQSGLPAILPLNLRGVHRDITGAFLKELESLGIRTTLWTDIDIDTLVRFQSYLYSLESQGSLSVRTASISRCSCGKTEIESRLDSEESLRSSHKTFVREGSLIRCLLCGTVCEPEQSVSLYLRLPRTEYANMGVRSTATFAERELRSLVDSFSCRDMRISRKRDTGLHLQACDAVWNVDPDFGWMCYLADRACLGNPVSTVLAGARTLKQTALAMLMCISLGAQLPRNIHCMPYVAFRTDGTGPKHQLRIRDLDDKKISRRGMRGAIALCFGSENKELAFPSSVVYTIHRSVDVELGGTDSSALPTTSLLETDHASLMSIFQKCRHKHGLHLTQSEREYLAALFSC